MKSLLSILSSISIVFLLTTPEALAQKKGQSAKISTGIVERAERVDLQSEAPKGAVIGGALGLLSAGGKSTSKKVRNTMLGGMAGGAIASSSQGSRYGMAYTVRTGTGSAIQIVTDQTEVRIGDCAIVEEAGGTANIRRVSPTMCEADSAKAMEQVQGSFQQEAEECLNAKQQLVEANNADDLDLAKRKMEILCSD